ncbi:MAG: ABC transporter ATP-binding protein [Candidatus Hodarchaeales archaeon]
MEPVVECNNITKKFATTLALDNVTLDFPGGVVGLVGPNGAGKTTLLKILLGLMWPTSGEGKVLGYDIRERKGREKIRQHCGYMAERDTFIYDVSAKKLVIHFCQLSGISRTDSMQRAHDVLSFCGIGEERHRLIGSFSKGMKQKLKLALAIVHSPSLIFLDEPTDGMDPEGRERMLMIIKNLANNSGKKIILSTHILPDIERIGDHLIVLDRGKVKASSPLKKLLRKFQNSIHLQVRGDPGFLLADLIKEGYAAKLVHESGEIELESKVNQKETLRDVMDLVRKNNLGLISLKPHSLKLEEVFMDILEEEGSLVPGD